MDLRHAALAQFSSSVAPALKTATTKQGFAKALRDAARPLIAAFRPRSEADVAALDKRLLYPLMMQGIVPEAPLGVFVRDRVREVAMLPWQVGFFSAAVVSFTPGTPVETEFATAATNWDITVNFDNVDYLTLAITNESGTISSLVIDPAGSAIAMDLSVSAANSVNKCWLYYKALTDLGLTGNKTVRLTWEASWQGNVVHRTYLGAAQAAPTPTDTDNAASVNILSNSLASPNVNGSLEWVGTTNLIATHTMLGGITQSGHIEVTTPSSFAGSQGYKDGSLADPSVPGMDWEGSNNRAACCAHVVNPA